jgi:hypothetical protein
VRPTCSKLVERVGLLAEVLLQLVEAPCVICQVLAVLCTKGIEPSVKRPMLMLIQALIGRIHCTKESRSQRRPQHVLMHSNSPSALESETGMLDPR